MTRRLVLNYKKLATNELRRDALDIIEAGLSAAKTEKAIRRHVAVNGSNLRIGKKVYLLDNYKKVFVVGCGKAALETARVLEKMLGNKITAGAVIDTHAGKLRRIKSLVGTHPFPSAKNLRATSEIVAILKQAGPKDLIIVIVSGGGSALMFWPHSVRLQEFVCITRNLMRSGATIREMNTVRKHLSSLQGGQMIKQLGGATTVALIYSDVPGDDVNVIASGPTVFDSTTVRDAIRVLKKYSIDKVCKISKNDFVETPKDRRIFKKVQNVLVVNNNVAIQAMIKAAREKGFRPKLLSTALTGEAREVGAMLAQKAKAGQVLIAGGETTVRVIGKGRGGRNQEVVIGALLKLPKNTLVLALASDGHDNSPAAGALADNAFNTVAKKMNIDLKKGLRSNNSYAITKKMGCQIYTGTTDINISDLFLVLKK